jgi:hypothetical protein
MFNRKIKQFQNHWLNSIQELKRDAEGLIEWFLIQENHKSSTISSSDIQSHLVELQSAAKVYEAQIEFLVDQIEARNIIKEVTDVLAQLEELLITGDPASTKIESEGSANVNIMEIVSGPVLTQLEIQKVLQMPFKSFAQQITGLSAVAKRYAYIGLLHYFLIEIRNKKIYNFNYLADLADALHNIPEFAAKGFDNFDDEMFWEPLFKKRDQGTKYILEVYLSGLARYHRWSSQLQNANI